MASFYGISLAAIISIKGASFRERPIASSKDDYSGCQKICPIHGFVIPSFPRRRESRKSQSQ
jgi:hypothetical protein